MLNRIIPVFVPHQGCPHDCVFCNQVKITGVSTTVDSKGVEKIVEDALKTIDMRANREIAFFGGSFTAIDIEKQTELLEVAGRYKKSGTVNDIRLSTRPDCISNEILDIHKKYGTTIIELGVQSMDKEVLEKSLRGHDEMCVYRSSKLIKEYGFTLGLQMMCGLPGDTEEKCIETAKKFISIKPSFVRIYPTLVIKDTELENLYRQGKYTPLTVEQAVETVKKLIVMYRKADIGVIRVGLQATDDITPGENMLAGPYHSAFGELVESMMIRDFIEDRLKKFKESKNSSENKKADSEKKGEQMKNTDGTEKSYHMNYRENSVMDMYVRVSNKNVSKLIGNKRANRNFFNEKYRCRTRLDVFNGEENFYLGIKFNEKDDYKFYTYKEFIEELYNIYGLDS